MVESGERLLFKLWYTSRYFRQVGQTGMKMVESENVQESAHACPACPPPPRLMQPGHQR